MFLVSMASRRNYRLSYFIVAGRAMLALSKTGFRTGRFNSFINFNAVSLRRYNFLRYSRRFTYGTILTGSETGLQTSRLFCFQIDLSVSIRIYIILEFLISTIKASINRITLCRASRRYYRIRINYYQIVFRKRKLFCLVLTTIAADIDNIALILTS